MQSDDRDELPAALKQQLPRYTAPPGLENRIRQQIAAQVQPGESVSWRERVMRAWQQWAGVGLGFAFGVALTFSIVQYRAGDGTDAIEKQLLASHVRSLMVAHLTDVESSDQHSVKPWFTGKLDYAPPVVDLRAQGFPLIGGRLDYLDGRAVAALVYRHGQHTINVYVLPAHRPLSPQNSALDGFNLARWTQANMQFWAISDINHEEMAKFIRAYQAQAID